jgi:N-acetylmuramoyl-L-alanine amidase
MAFKPRGIVVHSMGEYIQTSEGAEHAKSFLRGLGLSVHGFIDPEGRYIKMVNSKYKAYHAGVSEHLGLRGLNSNYLGFELLVEGTHTYRTFKKAIEQPGVYSQAQFETAVEVTQYWMDKYGIPKSNVVRHSDVAGDNVRGKGKGKIDPGSAFLWEEFLSNLVDCTEESS